MVLGGFPKLKITTLPMIRRYVAQSMGVKGVGWRAAMLGPGWAHTSPLGGACGGRRFLMVYSFRW